MTETKQWEKGRVGDGVLKTKPLSWELGPYSIDAWSDQQF